MKNSTVINLLEVRFPQCQFKEIDGVITSGEDSYIDGMDAFNYNSWSDDPSEIIWTMGVNNDLVEFVGNMLMYWECQDSGTYKLYSN